MEKIRISLKLNFTPQTLCCYELRIPGEEGLRQSDSKS